ncbi:zinc finger protein 37-like [Amphiprion ocellaris]|uniref:zinc finger protein 37-like n=1 Tax=Amphiprion ocellaris TaxID=80972 RepID=UPI0024115A14|nr:zinc finger protein 37-like [Amphiprion ocellaris]
MSSTFRHFINERLTAAAEEIFSEFEKTIVQYEEEIDRQRRLLDNIWKPQITQHTADLPQQHVYKEEEVLASQQLCNLEKNSSLDLDDQEHLQMKEEQEELCTGLDLEDPQPSQIKEEQEELRTSQEGEQLVLKREIDESRQHSDLPSSHYCPVDEAPGQDGRKLIDSGSTRNAEPNPDKRSHRNNSHSNTVDDSPVSESRCKTDTQCDVCGKIFKDKYQMKRHQRIHTGVKPYACNFCGKRFCQISSVKYHIRIHTGEKPHSCDTCGKSFRTSDGLTVHRRTHTGERPYSCKTCGKRFTQNGSLSAHMSIHTGQKKYSCRVCGKNFTKSGNLNMHMRTHTGERSWS